jgi:hypothetical protein
MLTTETSTPRLPSLPNPRYVRAVMAERRISRVRLAAASGLSVSYTSGFLTERVRPGELAAIKLLRGIRRLGLDIEAPRAS